MTGKIHVIMKYDDAWGAGIMTHKAFGTEKDANSMLSERFPDGFENKHIVIIKGDQMMPYMNHQQTIKTYGMKPVDNKK